MNRILVVDDEKGVCYSFRKIFGNRGYDVITALSGEEAIKSVVKYSPDLIIMDVTMPNIDGLETLKRIKSLYPNMKIIIMTAFSTSERAIQAMKYGAYDYITKPFDNTRLIELVENALKPERISDQVTINGIVDDRGSRIIGKCPRMLEIFKKIGQVTDSDVTVILRGETGTGKEKIARAISFHSKRADKPFLPVNCAAIPENLLESELFGYEKGAFTGAERVKIGKFEQCNHGTMFLDEIGDMPLSLQAKLLRVLEDGCFQRLGGKDMISTDVRIIAATNKNLEVMTKNNEFREDLYWRLNVVNIEIPPLRERGDDITELVKHFIQLFNIELQKDVKGIMPEVLEEFKKYEWPGNVRELQSIIKRGMVLCQNDYLTFDDCEWPSRYDVTKTGFGLDEMLSRAAETLLQLHDQEVYREGIASFERILIKKALEKTGNNQVMAARMLGISRNKLRSKIEKD